MIVDRNTNSVLYVPCSSVTLLNESLGSLCLWDGDSQPLVLSPTSWNSVFFSRTHLFNAGSWKVISLLMWMFDLCTYVMSVKSQRLLNLLGPKGVVSGRGWRRSNAEFLGWKIPTGGGRTYYQLLKYLFAHPLLTLFICTRAVNGAAEGDFIKANWEGSFHLSLPPNSSLCFMQSEFPG